MKEGKEKLIYTHVLTLSQNVICVWNNDVFIFEKNGDMTVDKLIYYVKLHHETFRNKDELYTYLSNVENDIIIFIDNNIPEIPFKCSDYGDMYRLFSYRKKRKILNEVEVVYVNMELPEEVKEKLDYVMEDIVQMWAYKIKDTKYFDEWEKRIEEGKWWKE